MRLIFVLTILSLFNSCSTYSDEQERIRMKEVIVSYLNEVNYKTTVGISDHTITIVGKDNFTDKESGNILLLKYLKKRYFQEHKVDEQIKFKIEIVYSKSKITTSLLPLQDLNNLFYWEIIEWALKNITLMDCVYYDLTSNEIAKFGQYNFDGDLWRLLNGVALKNEHATRSFLHFYSWSDVPYNEDTKFDQSKLKFVVNKIGIDPEILNEEYISNLYK